MADLKTCKIDGCPLTAASEVMTLPEGAKKNLCWPHQPREFRSLEREKRRAAYKAWYDSKAEWRADYFRRLHEQVYEVKS